MNRISKGNIKNEFFVTVYINASQYLIKYARILVYLIRDKYFCKKTVPFVSNREEDRIEMKAVYFLEIVF